MPSAQSQKPYSFNGERNMSSKMLLALLVLHCSASFTSVQAASALRAHTSMDRNALSRELENEYGSEKNDEYDNDIDVVDMVDETGELPVTNEEDEDMEDMSAEEETTEADSEENEEVFVATAEPTITMDKTTFVPDEPIKVSFNSGGLDASKWRIGIYMHMANPQDGALPPIASLSACPSGTKCTEGTVEFHDPNEMEFGDFDFIDQWGDWPLYPSFGYDAQLLDENGRGMAYPVPMFTFEYREEEDY